MGRKIIGKKPAESLLTITQPTLTYVVHTPRPVFSPGPLSVSARYAFAIVSVSADIRYYYIPPPLTVHFSMTRSVRYQPILHTLYYTLHTEHAYCLSYRFLNNVVITIVIKMVEMVEILDGRLGQRSVERVRYVINNLLHLVIVKYGDISLVLCISTRLRLVTILSLLVKYLVLYHSYYGNSHVIKVIISLLNFLGI